MIASAGPVLTYEIRPDTWDPDCRYFYGQGSTYSGLATQNLPEIGAQSPSSEALRANHVFHSLTKLLTLCNVWSVAPHPDDEDQTLLRGYALGGAKVGILSLTQGEGGGNKCGPQLGSELSSIRRHELQNAAKVAGASEVQFLNFPDFFAKTTEEVAKEWASRLPELVHWIRVNQPDVIVLRFRGSTTVCEGEAVAPGDDGAAHTYTTDLMLEAVKLANDPEFAPSGVLVQTFDVPSVILTDYCYYAKNAHPIPHHEVEISDTTVLNRVGEQIPLKEIGPRAAGKHYSQFGESTYDPRQGRPIYLTNLTNLAEEMTPEKIADRFNWIWSRFEGGEKISTAIRDIIKSFNPEDLSTIVPRLDELKNSITSLNIPHKIIGHKLAEIDDLISYINNEEAPSTARDFNKFPDQVSFTPHSNVKLVGWKGQQPRLRGLLRNHSEKTQEFELSLRDNNGKQIWSSEFKLKPGKTKRLSIPKPDSAKGGGFSWHIKIKGAEEKPALTFKRFAPPFRDIVHIEAAQSHLVDTLIGCKTLKDELPRHVTYLHSYDGIIPKQLEDLGLKVKRLTPKTLSKKSLRNTDLLIIGRDFVLEQLSPEHESAIQEYIKAGGKLLILEQMRKIYETGERKSSILPEILTPKEGRITTNNASVQVEEISQEWISIIAQISRGARALVNPSAESGNSQTLTTIPLATISEGDQTGLGVARTPYGVYCGIPLDRHLTTGNPSAWGFLLYLIKMATAQDLHSINNSSL